MRRKNLTAMAMAAMMIMSNVTPAMTVLASGGTEQSGGEGSSEQYNKVVVNEGESKVVDGDAVANYYNEDAVLAMSGSTVTVNGNATAAYGNAVRANIESSVTVNGNATAKDEGKAVDASLGSTVTVNGADGAAANKGNAVEADTATVKITNGSASSQAGYAVRAANDARVEVKKDAATGEGSVGTVYADGSTVSVGGKVENEGNGIAVYANNKSNVTIGTKSEENTTDEEKAPIIAVKSAQGSGVGVVSGSTAKVYGNIEAKDDALTVVSESDPYGVYAGSEAEVDGDVTSTDGKGVTAHGDSALEATVNVSGSVTSKDDAVTANKANVTIGTLPKETDGTDAEVEDTEPVITSSDGDGIIANNFSNVTANGSVDAYGSAIAAADGSVVKVNGDAKSVRGHGIASEIATITVTGDVDAEKSAGIEARDSTVTVTGDVNAAYGIVAENSEVTVKGTVTTSTGEAIIIAGSGKTAVLVGGDVKLSKTDGAASDKNLVIDVSDSENIESEIAVGGKLGEQGDKVQLQVNAVGDTLVVPEIVVGSVDLANVEVTDQNGAALTDEQQKAVKDNIQYIVSKETIGADGKTVEGTGILTITKNDGTALERDKADKYDVALAKEKLTVNVEVTTGYKLAKFKLNGNDISEGDSVLVKTGDNTYTLLVPADGSGVDLQAVIEAIEEEKKDETDKKDDSSDKKDETDKKDDAGKTDDSTKKDESETKKDESKEDDSSAKKDDSASKTDDAASKTDDSSTKTDTNTNGSTNNAVVIRSGSIGGSSSSSCAVKSVAASTSGSGSSQWNFNGTDWTYKKTDGSLAKGQWMYLTYNGHADWYYFDANGIMKSGWFQDADGNTYYLNPISDGQKGAMKKGSVEIDGKVYVFSDGTTAGVPEGALIK